MSAASFENGEVTSGRHLSVWDHRDDIFKTQTKYPKLDKDVSTEVCIIGAGIAGLHIALELAKVGKKVVVIDDGKVGSGETGRTTGQLSADNEYPDLIKTHGLKIASIVAASSQRAIERIGEIVKEYKIDCDYERVSGYTFHGKPTADKDYDPSVVKELYDSANETAALSVALIDDAQIEGFSSGKTLEYKNQASFHPTKYIQALAEIITTQLGGTIYEQTHMNELDAKDQPQGCKVITSSGFTVTADNAVFATNVPLQKLAIIDRLEPYRTFAIAVKIKTADVSKSGKNALWWDTADPYHYVRSTPHQEEGYSLLIVGGEDEMVGQIDDYAERYERLEAWTREHWTKAGAVEYTWSGQVNETPDSLAYIGRNIWTTKANVYVHTGDNGDGLTYAAIGGILIRDLITGKKNEWESVYAPDRQLSASQPLRAIKALPSYIMGNLSEQINYTKWLTTATKTTADIEDLVPGEGCVVRDGMQPVAAYKDADGTVHKMTAICPHLKAIVQWNPDEKSFDCPVHGSRFTCKGMVVNGPAIGNLAPSDQSKASQDILQ